MFQISESVVMRASPQVHFEPEQMRWLHVPKTGTSFINVLATWGCPGIAADEVIEWKPELGREPFEVQWVRNNAASKCRFSPNFCVGHDSIGEGCNNVSGRSYAAMFRQPEQRMISGYLHNFNGYIGDRTNLTMSGYAHGCTGCYVRKTTGYQCCNKQAPINVAQAVDTLHTRFAFVGLTDEWDLSVCLFHRMFGGACHPREFKNVRPGRNLSGGAGYDTAMLDGFTDEADNAFYDEAKTIFWKNIEQFAVTEASCREISCAPSS